jgi:hypothetical protein
MATFQITPVAHVAADLVTARFGMSEDLVNRYDSESVAALDALAVGDFSVPMGNLDLALETLAPPNIGEAPSPDAVAPYVAQAQPVALNDIAALRALLGLVDITVDQVDLPSLEVISPAISLPDAPDDALPTVPTDVPAISDPSIPVSPTLDMPAVPVLDETVLPSPPEIAFAQFEGELPTADLTPPEPMFVYDEATYQSDLADAIKTKLYNDVTIGTAVYTEEVWTAIWERALSDLDVELVKAYNQVLNNWEQWNYEMPDGVLSSALQEALAEDTRARLNLDRDITFKRAELQQQQTQFAITSGMAFEKQVMGFTNQVAQRAFEVARYRVQAVIDAFTLKVNAFNARMEGYKVLAQVFESRIRAELAKVELYKAQMEGAKIHGELQLQKVQIYSARVDALKVLIELYKAQMDGARLQTEIDRARIDAFKAKIDAVVAQISGVTAKFNLYQARIAGETAKVDLYGKQVTAYATQVQATKVVADINLAQMQALVEGNKDKVAVLTSALDKYKADTQYELGKDETGAKVYTAQMAGYDAEVRREGEYLRAKVDNFKAQVSEVVGRAELIVKEMDANLRAATAAKEIQMEALKAVAGLYTQKVASALTSVSANAQIGFNEGLSQSYSAQESNSFSIIDSHSTTDTTSDSTVEQTIIQG